VRAADAGNTGIANVVIFTSVTPTRVPNAATQTDANGNYSIPNLQAGRQLLVLSGEAGSVFTPRPTFSHLSSNQTLNFLAATVTGLLQDCFRQIRVAMIQATTMAASITISKVAMNSRPWRRDHGDSKLAKAILPINPVTGQQEI